MEEILTGERQDRLYPEGAARLLLEQVFGDAPPSSGIDMQDPQPNGKPDDDPDGDRDFGEDDAKKPSDN